MPQISMISGMERFEKQAIDPRIAHPVTGKFFVGELVWHVKQNYRGVVFDVDPMFMLTDDWYDKVAVSRPPKDRPWYHVLVHGGTQQTYVAERHLQSASDVDPIDHPALDQVFSEFAKGRYWPLQTIN